MTTLYERKPVFTSYYGLYAQVMKNPGKYPKAFKEFQEANVLSISVRTPYWFKGGWMGHHFGPDMYTLNGFKKGHKVGDTEWYTKRYLDKLNKSTPEKDYDLLCYLCRNAQGPIILFCYEKPEDFCHRHILADWFKPVVKVEEYKLEEPK